ncbi:MAG: hypothetical protein NG712_02105 [Omnitrophica bacterium]|nr:hypothetical protein [Candidatus Omnitrophota bacterium]
MRDIMFKNLTSLDHHRRDIFLSEDSVQNGVTTKTQKHFIYFIRDHEFLDDPQKLEDWLKSYAGNGPRLKNLSVLKSYDSKTGEEKFEVKIIGNLYILREQDIFNVDFTQIFKIDRKGEILKGQKK